MLKAQIEIIKIRISGYDLYIKMNILEDLSLTETMAKFTPIFSKWRNDYKAMINYMYKNGYSFKSLNGYGKYDLEKEHAYLRYDVHIRDILASFGIAQLNINNKIPGVFYINWDFTGIEEYYREQFLCLKKFDPKYTHFGFHANPVASWFIREKFQDRTIDAINFIKSDKFVEYIRDLEKAIDKKGTESVEYKEIVNGAEKYLEKTAHSFLEHFPDAKTVTGHGNILTSRARSIIRPDEQYNCLRKIFSSVKFLTEERIKPLGFDCEATSSQSAFSGTEYYYCIFDGNTSADYKKNLIKRINEKIPIILVFHPYRWQDNCFAGRFNGQSKPKPVFKFENFLKNLFSRSGNKKNSATAANKPVLNSSTTNPHETYADPEMLNLDKVIFIMGFARGGTTWMRRSLQTHPDVTEVRSEINFYREHKKKS